MAISLKDNGDLKKITTIAIYVYNYWKAKQNTVANSFFQKNQVVAVGFILNLQQFFKNQIFMLFIIAVQ